MVRSDGTVQTAGDASGRLPTRLKAVWRQMRQTRHTLTLKGPGFLFKWEFDEYINKASDDAYGRCDDVQK